MFECLAYELLVELMIHIRNSVLLTLPIWHFNTLKTVWIHMISADSMVNDMELISISLLDDLSIPREDVERTRRESMNCLSRRSLDCAALRNIQLFKNL
jgi:hypothetical protein